MLFTNIKTIPIKQGLYTVCFMRIIARIEIHTLLHSNVQLYIILFIIQRTQKSLSLFFINSTNNSPQASSIKSRAWLKSFILP